MTEKIRTCELATLLDTSAFDDARQTHLFRVGPNVNVKYAPTVAVGEHIRVDTKEPKWSVGYVEARSMQKISKTLGLKPVMTDHEIEVPAYHSKREEYVGPELEEGRKIDRTIWNLASDVAAIKSMEDLPLGTENSMKDYGMNSTRTTGIDKCYEVLEIDL